MALRYLLAAIVITATGCASAGRVTATASPASPLAVSLSTRVAFEPASVVVSARVEPDERNREILIEWWNDEGAGGSHAISLEGQRAPIRHGFAIRSLGAGEYVVTASLGRTGGKNVQRTARIVVIPEDGRMDRETAVRLTQ